MSPHKFMASASSHPAPKNNLYAKKGDTCHIRLSHMCNTFVAHHVQLGVSRALRRALRASFFRCCCHVQMALSESNELVMIHAA